MPDEQLAGQVAPVIDETTPVAQATPEGQTDGPTDEKESPAEKTFTQKELDEILQTRLAEKHSKSSPH